MTRKKCLSCKEEFKNKRSDAKYCSSKCRKSYNNLKNPEKRKEVNRRYYEKRKNKES